MQGRSFTSMVNLILKALALAMGVAVVILSILGNADLALTEGASPQPVPVGGRIGPVSFQVGGGSFFDVYVIQGGPNTEYAPNPASSDGGTGDRVEVYLNGVLQTEAMWKAAAGSVLPWVGLKWLTGGQLTELSIQPWAGSSSQVAGLNRWCNATADILYAKENFSSSPRTMQLALKFSF